MNEAVLVFVEHEETKLENLYGLKQGVRHHSNDELPKINLPRVTEQ